MKTLRIVWQWLNGNKTIITGALWGLLQTSVVKNHIPVETLEILQWGTGTLAALSGVHHFSKGYFSTKVGNAGQVIPEPKIPKINK